MTFSCPNYNHKTATCQRLNKLCVAGRPGCVLEGKVEFGEDIDVRINRAEERARLSIRPKPDSNRDSS